MNRQAEEAEIDDLSIPDCSFSNTRERPCTQPLLGHQQPPVDRSAITNPNITTAAQYFTDPSFQNHLNTFRDVASVNGYSEVDNGLRQVFLGLSSLFQALANPNGEAQYSQGQDTSTYGIPV
jgi:hypothetical protein